MGPRNWLPALLVFLTLLGSQVTATLAQELELPGLRDMVYVSPTWGYSVRWYSDEWTLEEETSSEGVDSLSLVDPVGNAVVFQGSAQYGGNAINCLDDLIDTVEIAAGAEGITVVTDELDAPQELRRPWRAWILLLVAGEDPTGAEDAVIYLDCRTLAPDSAVLVRYVVAAAATFEESYWRFNVLNAAMPRSAWKADGSGALTAPAAYPSEIFAPLPADSQAPWEYPGQPRLLLASDGTELGMMMEVDGLYDRPIRLLRVENSGAAPLLIDPALFRASNVLSEPRPDPDIAPTLAVWEETAEQGPRLIDVGDAVTLRIEFPDLQPLTTQATFLTYWDDRLRDGAVALNCLDRCGYGGGGFTPNLRIGR